MSEFIIEGGHKLSGCIYPQGSKNEALQVLCATLLTQEPVTISNIPNIRDVRQLIEILRLIGVKITPMAEDTYSFQADDLNMRMLTTDRFYELSGSIRASIMMLGPLLARFNRAFAARPGGDKIGRRPLTTHFEGLEKLGAKVELSPNGNFFKLTADHLSGATILLNEASVTGTANIIMAAVLAEGRTVIYNAACEPYIYQLCTMLNRMGAQIDGIGSNLLTINGVDVLNGCVHRVLPDMIEVGSFIGMAALTQSSLTIKNCGCEHLGIIPYTFSKLGIDFVQKDDDIIVHEQDCYEVEANMDGSILTISDAPWPGFTPDLISIALVTAVQAQGSVLIHQKMFESRLFFVDNLQAMGARITLCDPHRAIVTGLHRKYNLRATTMTSPDIRAGVSLLIAALSADGTSIIQNVEQIDRGYQNIVERLKALGAVIERKN